MLTMDKMNKQLIWFGLLVGTRGRSLIFWSDGPVFLSISSEPAMSYVRGD